MTGNAAEKGFNFQPLSAENWHAWWLIVPRGTPLSFLTLTSDNSLCWLWFLSWLSWIRSTWFIHPSCHPQGTAARWCSHVPLQTLFAPFPYFGGTSPYVDTRMFPMTLPIIDKFLQVCESSCSSLQNKPPEQVLCCFPWMDFPSLESTMGFQRHVEADERRGIRSLFGILLCLWPEMFSKQWLIR